MSSMSCGVRGGVRFLLMKCSETVACLEEVGVSTGGRFRRNGPYVSFLSLLQRLRLQCIM